jgi:Zn-dependent protease
MADAPAVDPPAPGPWAIAETAAPEAEPRPAAPSPRTELFWGVVSTLLLAGWIALWGGWLASLALIIGVFVHEFGHMLVINWAGCGPSRIRIIPFFGGAATMERAPDSDFRGVLIALAGPAFGMLAAIPFMLAADVTHVRGWMAGAFYVASLNLINLLPAAPLDGSKALGPALARIHPWLERGALAVIAVAALVWAVRHDSFMFAAVIAFGALRAFVTGGGAPTARRLTAIEWAASVALFMFVFGVWAAVTLLTARGAGLTLALPSFHGFGGAR